MNGRFAAVVLLLAVSGAACSSRDEGVLEGTWVGQSAETGGKAGGFREVWTFKDGTITTQNDAQFTYQVDASADPKQIDITTNYPTDNGKVRMGIYKIEEDTLTICQLNLRIAKPDAKRPEDSDTTKRNDVVVLTFRREQEDAGR